MNPRTGVVLVSLAATASLGQAQSLFMRAPQPDVILEDRFDPNAALAAASMFLVEPPEPREFAVHDIIYVVVDESTRASSSQSLETGKEYDSTQSINAFIDPAELLELRVRQGDASNITVLDVEADQEFKGDGAYDRSDRISARIAAEIIDIKPNGTLVLEAAKTVGTDDETRKLVLSGNCRQEDVTNANSILSSQLADLRLRIENEGELRKASKKGLITRVLESIFDF